MERGNHPADRFQVNLFGSFRIFRNTLPVTLPTQKSEALFAYLLLHPEPHTREKLAALFWGDSSTEKAYGSLRQALASLRKRLTQQIIEAERDTVQLNRQVTMRVDVREFENQAHRFLTDPLEFQTHIEITLYQGELLADFFDAWILPLREHYNALYIDVLLRLVETSRSQSQYKKAIGYAQRVLENTPLNERAHQHLMFCHLMAGNRNEALLQYQTCKQILAEELGIEPAPETTALFNWIRQTNTGSPSLAARLTNLPIPISSFVGRERELSQIKQTVAHSRLVTLTGAGGSGKTRLAIQAGTALLDSFKDGVWWVELAPLTDEKMVPAATATALGIQGRPDQMLSDTLSHFLRTKKILLIFDNCEHLVNACAQLIEHLLNTCFNLQIITTSREVLGLPGEHIWQVPTMNLPAPENANIADLLMQYEGIHLFVERASAAASNFELSGKNASAVVQICHQLDGIPLAIELAAARVKILSVEQIAARLGNRFGLLSAGNRTSHTRHQTLRSTVDWSYDLLSEPERALFSRLSVFSDGWELEAAEDICSGDGIPRENVLMLLSRLVDKSLVNVNETHRYNMLETLRQYAAEKLEHAGQTLSLRERHLDYFLNLAHTGDQKVRGPEQLAWVNRLNDEQDNFNSALELALGDPQLLDNGCDLIASLAWYLGMIGNFIQMKRWLEATLPACAQIGPTPAHARLLFYAGSMSVWGLNWLDATQAQDLINESLDIWQKLGANYRLEVGQCIMTTGWIRKGYFNDPTGYDLMEKAIGIFKETGNKWWHAWTLNILAGMYEMDDAPTELILQQIDLGISLWEDEGDRFSIAVISFDKGLRDIKAGGFKKALDCLHENLEIFRKFNCQGYIFQVLENLGDLLRRTGQYEQSEAYYSECISIAPLLFWDSSCARFFRGMGFAALHQKDVKRAEECFWKSLELSQEYDLLHEKLLSIAGFAALKVVSGYPEISARLFGAFDARLAEFRGKNHANNLPSPVDQWEIETYTSDCRARLEKTAFEQAWGSSRALTLEEVLSEITQLSPVQTT